MAAASLARKEAGRRERASERASRWRGESCGVSVPPPACLRGAGSGGMGSWQSSAAAGDSEASR